MPGAAIESMVTPLATDRLTHVNFDTGTQRGYDMDETCHTPKEACPAACRSVVAGHGDKVFDIASHSRRKLAHDNMRARAWSKGQVASLRPRTR